MRYHRVGLLDLVVGREYVFTTAWYYGRSVPHRAGVYEGTTRLLGHSPALLFRNSSFPGFLDVEPFWVLAVHTVTEGTVHIHEVVE